MIVEGRNFTSLCEELGSIQARWHDVVVPDDVELLPNNPYSPRYAWMFTYEKQLKYRIEEARGRALGPVERELFGVESVLSEALSNAFVHGHRRNTSLPIHVECALGERGLAFSIRDQGPGFDTAEVARRADRGGSYYSYAGSGLRTLSRKQNVVASYGDGGRTLNLRIDCF